MSKTQLLVSLVLVLAIVLALRLTLVLTSVSVPVQKIENYLETEVRNEPYTAIEKEETVTPVQVQLCKGNFSVTPQQYVFVELERDPANNSITVTEAKSNLEVTLYRDTVVAGSTATDCKIIFKWSSRCTGSDDYTLIGEIGQMIYLSPATSFLSPFMRREADSGNIFYPLGGIASQRIGVRFSGKPVTVYNFPGTSIPSCHVSSYNIYYTWNDYGVKEKEVTKYREIPVQVSKQRTITEYEKVSLWDYLFRK